MLTSTVPHLSAAQILDRLGSVDDSQRATQSRFPPNHKTIHNFVIGNVSDFQVVQSTDPKEILLHWLLINVLNFFRKFTDIDTSIFSGIGLYTDIDTKLHLDIDINNF